MTSAEQITDLIGHITALKDYFEGARLSLDNAQARLPDLLHVISYVDEVAGLPGGTGASDDPFPTLDAAILAVADGQSAEIRLLTDANWTVRPTVNSRSYRVIGWNLAGNTTQSRNLTFSAASSDVAGSVPGLAARGMSSVMFQALDVTMPADDGSVSDAVFRAVGFMNIGMVGVGMTGTNGNVALINAYSGGFAINVAILTATDMGGRWVHGKAAGTALTADTTGGLIDVGVSNA